MPLQHQSGKEERKRGGEKRLLFWMAGLNKERQRKGEGEEGKEN